MELHVDDAAFVRGDAPTVYRLLVDVGSWDDWWPAMRTVPRDHGRWHVMTGPRLRPVRLDLEPHGRRPDIGVRFRVTGDLVGRTEFWLEPGWGGTVVHHVARLDVDRARDGARFRRAVRRGMWACKDRVQDEVLRRGDEAA